MNTYTIEMRKTGTREFIKMAFGYTNNEADREISHIFSFYGMVGQVVKTNERTGRVVGRYEQDYDSRAKCMVVKRVATR